jgi:hypothetical protein
MSREEGPERTQRTVAELLAKYGSGTDGTTPRRRRRRADDIGDTAPQAIINRVLSDTGSLQRIRDDREADNPPTEYVAPPSRKAPQPPTPEPKTQRSTPAKPPQQTGAHSQPAERHVRPDRWEGQERRESQERRDRQPPRSTSGAAATAYRQPPTPSQSPLAARLGSAGGTGRVDNTENFARYGKDTERTEVSEKAKSPPLNRQPGQQSLSRQPGQSSLPRQPGQQSLSGQPGQQSLPRRSTRGTLGPAGPQPPAPQPGQQTGHQQQPGQRSGPQRPMRPHGEQSSPGIAPVYPTQEPDFPTEYHEFPPELNETYGGDLNMGYTGEQLSVSRDDLSLDDLSRDDFSRDNYSSDSFPREGDSSGYLAPFNYFDERERDSRDLDERDSRELDVPDLDSRDRGPRDREQLDRDQRDRKKRKPKRDKEFPKDEFRDDTASAEPTSPVRQWLSMAGQLALGVLGGAGVWLAFNWLWGFLPAAALGGAVVVIVGLVWIVRYIRKAEDMQTTVLAVLVGLVVTVSPAALLLLSR